jgi:hypothetical protein
VNDGVFRTGAFRVTTMLQVPGIVQKDCGDSQLNHPLIQPGLGAGVMPALEQSCHAKGALQRMFKIVIWRIQRLIILAASRKIIRRQSKKFPNESLIAVGKNGVVSCLNFHRDGCRVFCDHWRVHLRSEIMANPAGMHALNGRISREAV